MEKKRKTIHTIYANSPVQYCNVTHLVKYWNFQFSDSNDDLRVMMLLDLTTQINCSFYCPRFHHKYKPSAKPLDNTHNNIRSDSDSCNVLALL